MKKVLAACLAFAASTLCAAALAATGEYWEITARMEMPGMPFAMPATTQKICVGKGKEKDPQHSSKDKDCEMTDVKISGNKTSWSVRCNNKGEIMTGTGEQTTSTDSYQGTMHLSGKSHGQDMSMTNTYSGKRVGGACDTEELVKQANKQIAQSCDLSGHSSAELVSMADMYLAKDALCADKRDAMCSAVRKDAGSDADTYASLARHDKNLTGGSVAVAKACGLNMAATTSSICKTLNGKNYKKLSAYCPAEAKAWRVAARKKECEGRSYTAHENLSKCLSGDDSAYNGDSESADDSATQTASDKAKSGSGSATDSAMESAKKLKDNPAGAVLDGAKKLKGLFGF